MPLAVQAKQSELLAVVRAELRVLTQTGTTQLEAILEPDIVRQEVSREGLKAVALKAQPVTQGRI